MSYSALVKNGYPVLSISEKNSETPALEQILKAGRAAASAAEGQEVLVIRGSRELSTLAQCAPSPVRASMALLVGRDGARPGHRAEAGHQAEIAGIQNKAADLGLESAWVETYDQQEIRQNFSLPEDYEVEGLLYIGHRPSKFFRLAAATF